MHATRENNGFWKVEKALPNQLYLNLMEVWPKAGYGSKQQAIDAVKKEIEKLNMPYSQKVDNPIEYDDADEKEPGKVIFRNKAGIECIVLVDVR
jgi:hypothetical protein